MNPDDTRKLLKIFGVAMTDFEAEAARLSAAASSASPDELRAILGSGAELCRELDQRWMEMTRHVFATREKLLAALAAAARR